MEACPVCGRQLPEVVKLATTDNVPARMVQALRETSPAYTSAEFAAPVVIWTDDKLPCQVSRASAPTDADTLYKIAMGGDAIYITRRLLNVVSNKINKDR